MSGRGYQRDFASSHAAMYDETGRERKAITMVAVLRDALGDGLRHARCLNIGCSTGIIDKFLAPFVGTMTGLDIDEAAIAYANEHHATGNLSFRVGDAMAIDAADQSIDVVVCSQVYEHVPDPDRMMREIRRVLTPGGVCYFAATNRLCVVEQHYFLPFLSMLPPALADRYLQITGKGTHYYERHRTYWNLKRLVSAFDVSDYTRKLIDDSDRFHTRYMTGTGIKATILKAWIRVAYWSFPGYIWLLRKR